jgi:hypothetical protein
MSFSQVEIVLKRDEAVLVLKELLDGCSSIDGHSLELSPPSPVGGYQIIVKGALDEPTKKFIIDLASKHQLTCQLGNFWRTKQSTAKTGPDTLIIYKPKPPNK